VVLEPVSVRLSLAVPPYVFAVVVIRTVSRGLGDGDDHVVIVIGCLPVSGHCEESDPAQGVEMN